MTGRKWSKGASNESIMSKYENLDIYGHLKVACSPIIAYFDVRNRSKLDNGKMDLLRKPVKRTAEKRNYGYRRHKYLLPFLQLWDLIVDIPFNSTRHYLRFRARKPCQRRLFQAAPILSSELKSAALVLSRFHHISPLHRPTINYSSNPMMSLSPTKDSHPDVLYGSHDINKITTFLGAIE